MCDIITIHLPLNEHTHYLIDRKLIQSMKRGVMLINTSRGAIIKTQDVIDGLITGQIGYFGTDVYEYEKGIFFHDHSGETLKDTMLKKLMSFSNVLVTPHQAFATQEALANIARHSQAHHADVRLDYTPDRVTLTIQDDGQGFDPQQITAGLGTHSMRERAATLPRGALTLDTAHGRGTRMTVQCYT